MFAMGKTKLVLLSLSLFLLLCLTQGQALATRLPDPLKKAVQSAFPGTEVRIRLDGVLQVGKEDLFVPVIPKDKVDLSSDVQLLSKIPATNPRVLVFNNKWVFIRLIKEGDKLIFSLPDGSPEDFKDKLLTGHLPPDLIVPQGMTTSEEYQSLIGELDIEVIKAEKQPEETVEKTETAEPIEKRDGTVFLTSPATGKIIVMDGLEKSSELVTDGTPAGMTCCNGKLYICDQTKNRILVLDPVAKKFLDPIALPPGASPKGIASMARGKFLYVCETAQNYVSVVEIESGKALMRTRVRPGPTKVAITPSGYMLLVLNGQSGEVTFVSTLNQKAVGFVKVGELPSEVIISKNSKAAFVTNRVSNTVSIIDIANRRVARTLKVGEGPTGIALSPDEQLLFVANAKDNTIVAYKIPDYTKAKDVQLPLDVEFPSKIMFIPGTQKLLVTSAATDTVGVLDTETMEFSEQPRIGCTTDNAIWIDKAE